MSTIIALKDGEQLVLGTDSRFVTHTFNVHSDSVEKVIEVGPDTFLATSGFTMATDFTAQRARELVQELGTTDIVTLAEKLDHALRPRLKELVSVLEHFRGAHENLAKCVAGTRELHGYVLAGHSRGRLGFVFRGYSACDGQVTLKDRKDYFGTERRLEVVGGEPVRHLAQDPRTWLYPVVDVVQMFLAEQRRVNTHCGGLDQIVVLDRNGARWVSRLPAPEPAGAQLTHATISASVTMTSPTLLITGAGGGKIEVSTSGGQVIIDPARVGIEILASGVDRWSLHSGGLVGNNAAGSNTVIINNLGANVALFDGGTEKCFLSAQLVELRMNGQKVLGVRQTGPGNSTDITDTANKFNNLLTALRAHGLIT